MVTSWFSLRSAFGVTVNEDAADAGDDQATAATTDRALAQSLAGQS